MQPRDPDDDQDRVEEAIEERKLLNKLRLTAFTATPGTVQPFQPSTLAWKVLVPESVSSVINVTFTVGNHDVPATGTLPVSLLATGALALTAHSPLTSRMMGTQVVNVDLSGLVEAALPRASIQFVAQVVKDLFRAGSLSTRGDLSVQMLPPDGLRLKVPLSADIPNFFNADIDVELDIRVSVKSLPVGTRVASARLSAVSVDVIFHVAEHIFSGGAATAAQDLIQPLAADLIKGFLGPQIETTFVRPLQEAIDVFLALSRGADPAHRIYRLHSITADPAGLIILSAPVPSPSGTGGAGGIGGPGGVVVKKTATRRAGTPNSANRADGKRRRRSSV
jgi:hypothetical protein